MPRLPTMRVIGSHAISTSSVIPASPSPSPGASGAGGQLATGLAPLGLPVEGVRGETAQAADGRAVDADGAGGQPPARRFVHERHELVRETGHGAADADAADVGAAADAVHPAALGHVALDHRAPPAELDDALRRAVLGGEVGLLVVTGAVAALVDGLAEQPGRPQLLVQRD